MFNCSLNSVFSERAVEHDLVQLYIISDYINTNCYIYISIN